MHWLSHVDSPITLSQMFPFPFFNSVSWQPYLPLCFSSINLNHWWLDPKRLVSSACTDPLRSKWWCSRVPRVPVIPMKCPVYSENYVIFFFNLRPYCSSFPYTMSTLVFCLSSSSIFSFAWLRAFVLSFCLPETVSLALCLASCFLWFISQLKC